MSEERRKTFHYAIIRMDLFEARRLPQLDHCRCRAYEASVWNGLEPIR